MANRLDTGALLGHLPLFRNLDARQLALMARACQEVRIAKHGFAFQRGDPANGLYVVAVGTIKLAIPSPSGQEKVLEFFTAGQAFGEAVMFLDKPYMVQAQALEDTLLLWIDKQDIYAAIDHDPSFARRMLAGLSLRLHALVQDIEAVNLQNATQRVAGYLLRQPREDGQIHLSVNKNVVASKLGLTPETLSRLLGQLSGKGYIAVEGRDVQLLDAAALEALLYGR
ncbi:Crp/Fnr family transcriptional regulator [Chitinimonas koreensis]|uniref:Crp/Fnr family transcriptional regulator n=1 Tax=Chitinimonas koreensis TaxID=356302 RepID=UPI0003F5F61A|nr:Crp/Fnr family transcriptional regulator [Chitinimonas koreensis]QNM95128.1 Crp/Fnr family transcriptional regulator [Chitinimonas koreensis]